MPGQHYGKRVKADQMGISKGDPDVHKVVAVSTLFKPSEIVAIDKLIDVYGSDGRSGMVKRIVRHFLEMADDKQRATLLASELVQKKAEALLEKQRLEKELERIEADMKRIGIAGG
jgi:hypothetical protein